MKEYPNTYENYYNNEKNHKLDPDKIEIKGDISFEKYIQTLNQEISEYQKELFNRIVRMIWLFRKFCYNDTRGTRGSVRAFNVFVRNYVGYESKMITYENKFYVISSFIEDFFPNFEEGDPFVESYEYPYKYMNLECLTLVYKMDERLELLKIGEERSMSYVDFVNYVINYVMSYNEEHGDVFNLCYTGVISIEKIKKVKEKKESSRVRYYDSSKEIIHI